MPITFCTPGIGAFNKADHRRAHGINRNATRTPLGPALLEARPRERRRLHLSRPHSRSCGHRFDPIPRAKLQGCRHDLAQYCLWRSRNYRLLSSHAGTQDPQDQPVHRAILDFLGCLQRLWPSSELGRISSPPPLRDRHARGHLKSQAGRLLVGASSLALSNSARRQEALAPELTGGVYKILGWAETPVIVFSKCVRLVLGLRRIGLLLVG